MPPSPDFPLGPIIPHLSRVPSAANPGRVRLRPFQVHQTCVPIYWWVVFCSIWGQRVRTCKLPASHTSLTFLRLGTQLLALAGVWFSFLDCLYVVPHLDVTPLRGGAGRDAPVATPSLMWWACSPISAPTCTWVTCFSHSDRRAVREMTLMVPVWALRRRTARLKASRRTCNRARSGRGWAGARGSATYCGGQRGPEVGDHVLSTSSPYCSTLWGLVCATPCPTEFLSQGHMLGQAQWANAP